MPPKLSKEYGRQKVWSKDLKSAGRVPNSTGSVVCFSQLWVPTRPKLRLRSAQPSSPQRSRSLFHSRNARKQPTQNIVSKKRAHWQGTDSDYLFDISKHPLAIGVRTNTQLSAQWADFHCHEANII